MTFIPPAMLAITFGELVGLVIFTVSVVSWIVNLVQGNQINRASQPKTGASIRKQSDLEIFLQDVLGGNPQQETTPAVASPQKPKQSRAQRGTQSIKDSKRERKNRPPNSNEPKQSVALLKTSHRESLPSLQASVRQGQFQGAIDSNRISEAVKQDMTFAAHRDIGSDAASDAIHRAGNIHPIARTLRDPNGLQQAIVLNEILARPKALR